MHNDAEFLSRLSSNGDDFDKREMRSFKEKCSYLRKKNYKG